MSENRTAANRAEQHKTTIGGQAVIEGIMMRSPLKTVMAVRRPDGSIQADLLNAKLSAKGIGGWPMVRGVVNMVLTLRFGFSCLMKSADLAELDQKDKDKEKKNSKFMDNLINTVSVVLGVGLAVGLFMVLPTFLVQVLERAVPLGGWKTLIEGVVKIALFIGYMWAVSFEKDIRRTYEYHGAEHKSIACYEAGEELTVENVRKFSRFHPRCGTSFILIVLVLSILLYSLVSWDGMVRRVITKLALLPVLVGVGYEIIRFAGRHDNPLTRIISAPGMWLQNLTTREPDDGQLEVAVTALQMVIPEDKSIDKW